MLTTHIDTLAEWWENAEDSDDFYPGDTWIKRRKADTGGWVYDVGRVTSKRRYYEARVLARAPKPKPAWHDAPAVTATYSDDYGTVTGVWTPSGNHGYWIGPEDDVVMHDSLEDVTPLIEAKVTDEARDRVWDELVHHGLIDPDKHRPSDSWTADVVHVALGLETE